MFAEDLDTFFDSDEFATPVHITPAGALAAVKVACIVREPGIDVLGVLTTDPTAQLPTASVPDAWSGAAARIAEGPMQGDYTVADHRPTGSGTSFLHLRKA